MDAVMARWRDREGDGRPELDGIWVEQFERICLHLAWVRMPKYLLQRASRVCSPQLRASAKPRVTRAGWLLSHLQRCAGSSTLSAGHPCHRSSEGEKAQSRSPWRCCWPEEQARSSLAQRVSVAVMHHEISGDCSLDTLCSCRRRAQMGSESAVGDSSECGACAEDATCERRA